MLCCLLLRMFHENMSLPCTCGQQMKGEAMRYCTPKERFNYSKPACEDVLVQIQHQAIPDNPLWNPSSSEMLHLSAFQQFSQHCSCKATACAGAVLWCDAWLTPCDVLHITPTLAACTFHKLHFINHYWRSAWTEALGSHVGGSLCAC